MTLLPAPSRVTFGLLVATLAWIGFTPRSLAQDGGDRPFDLTVSQPLDADAIASVAASHFERLSLLFHSPSWNRRPSLRVFSSHEEQGLTIGTTASSSLSDSGHDAFFVIEPGVSRQTGQAEALLFLVDRFGPPAAQWLRDGAAYALADTDAVKDYRATAAWIEQAGEATPIDALLDPTKYDSRSGLVQTPLAAIVVELMIETSIDTFVTAWKGNHVDASGWRKRYRSRLEHLAEEHHTWTESRRERRGELRANVEARGVCFAHEGYRVRDGYISDMARRSLERARGLGANAISLTPFGFFSSLSSPEVRWRRRSGDRAGGETDESILVAAKHARSFGQTVLLKPHLWGHGGWCGEIEMTSDDDWTRWFESYGEFLVHYALLAERGDFDWLSIGCELERTTVGHSEEWRRLAGRARRLFAGGITYSANWGGEMSTLGFADQLDAIGVDFYYSLSQSDQPSDDDLVRAASEALSEAATLSERHRRPVFLTEVGYPSRAAPWRTPYESNATDASFDDAQARCFRALTAAFYNQPSAPRVAGFFVWKWPTFDRWEESKRADYWPAGPKTLDALKGLLTGSGGVLRK